MSLPSIAVNSIGNFQSSMPSMESTSQRAMVAWTSSRGKAMSLVSSLGFVVGGGPRSGLAGLVPATCRFQLGERFFSPGEALDLGRLLRLKVLVDAEEVG